LSNFREKLGLYFRKHVYLHIQPGNTFWSIVPWISFRYRGASRMFRTGS